MNILIIPQSDWIFGPTNRIHEIADILSEKNNVFVWNFKLFKYGKPYHSADKVKLINSISIQSNNILLFYLLNIIPHALSFFKKVRRLKIDIIINQNLIPGLWAFFLSPSSVLKIFDIQDYYPEIALNYFQTRGNFLKKFIKSIAWMVMINIIKLTDICTSVNLSFINLVHNISKKKVYFLPNGIDTSFFHYVKSNKSLKKKLGLSENVLLYFGLVEYWLDFETVLFGLKLLKLHIPDIKLLIIGSTITGYTKQLEKKIKEAGLEEYAIITGYIPHKELPYYLNLGTIGIMPYKLETYSEKTRLPLKFFLYSAMAKPVLSVDLSEIKILNPKHVIYYKNPQEFANKARLILNNKKLLTDLKYYARKFSMKFDYSVLATRLETILKNNLKNFSA